MKTASGSRSNYNFGPMHEAMRRYVDREIVAGISTAVMVGRDVVDTHVAGWADREAGTLLREDHIFRIFSNTKLVTSCAVLLLVEEGRIGLDDPVERYLPRLARRRVLRPGATHLEDTEPAASPMTVRQLLSHSAGLGYGLFDEGTLIFDAYNRCGVRDPHRSLADMVEILAMLPLVFHPGTSWEYSVATDVLARVIEVVDGRSFDAFVHERVLAPLGMKDTGFVVPADQRHRLVAFYAGADPARPLSGGLTRVDAAPYPDAYLRRFPRISGGGGLVSTLPDMIALLRGLMPGPRSLLQPSTAALLTTNQLRQGVCLRLPGFGVLPDKVFSVAGALTMVPPRGSARSSVGELQWGGIAGTHWWINPAANIAGVLMTQRQMSFWHPFSFELKRLAYQGVGLD